MSSLNEVFGDDYHQKAHQGRVDHVLNIIINNLANREFVYRLDGCDMLWSNDRLESDAVRQICERVNSLNPKLTVRHIDIRNPHQRKILPFFLENTPVEYFYIIDEEMSRCYLIFVTPSQIGAY